MFAEIPADAVILSRNDAARRGLWCGTGPLTVQPASLKPFRGPNGAWVMQFVFFSVLFFFFCFSVGATQRIESTWVTGTGGEREGGRCLGAT